MDELKQLLGEERGLELMKICADEKVTDIKMLRCMPTETLRLMGFRFGEIAKLSVNQYNSKHQDEQVKVLLAKIRDRYQSKDGTKKIKKDNVNEAKQTRNKTSKLHVGWLHSNDGSKYVQKRLCDGGGTRELLVCVNEMTFDSLKERMITIFLGHSSKLYEVKIGNFKREIIQSFRDLNNEECSLKTYMTDHGLFASKFRLYLMTTSVMDAEFIESNPSDLKCDILSHVPNSDHVFGTDPTFTEKSKTSSVMDAEFIDSDPADLKSDILSHIPNSDHVFGTDSTFTEKSKTTSVMDAEFIDSDPADLKSDILSHIPNSDHVFGTDSTFTEKSKTTSVMDAEFIDSDPPDLKSDILAHVPNSDHVFGTDPTFTEKSKTTSVMDAEFIDSNPPYLKSDILAHVPNSDYVFGTDPTFTEKSKTTSVMDADFIESNPPELKSDILDHVPNSNAMFTENPLSTQEPVDILQNSDPEMNLDNNRSKTRNLSIEHLSCDRPIDVTFVKYYQPEHDTEIILRQSCFSREECYRLTTGILYHDQKLEEYNPFDDNYELRTITVGDELLLSEECQDDRTLRYLLKPKIDAHNTNSLIVYHPKDVCGFFETELIIGVILVEKQSVAQYTWYRNNKIYAGGVGLACIWVYEPGTYHVSVSVSEDKWDISQPVTITEKKIIHTKSLGASSGIQTIQEHDIFFNETDLIGKGSFSSVYRGKWIGTDVAIKRFSLKRQRQAISAAVEQESLILCRVRHPNIVQIMGTVTNNNYIMLISELVDGENLENILFDPDCSIKLSDNTREHIGKQIIKAIVYLHNISPPIIHRDIKSANILVAKSSFNTKLCDLGLSKIKVTQTAMYTRNTHVPGTIMYMAPELLLTDNNIANEATDMWSVGCVLLELFTNKETWETNDTELDLVNFIKSEMTRNRVPVGIQYLIDRKCSWSSVINRCFAYKVIKRITAKEILNLVN